MRNFPAGLVVLLAALFAAAAYFAVQFVFLLEAHEYFRRKLGMPLPLEDRAPGWVLCLLPIIIALVSMLLLLMRRRPSSAAIVITLLWIGFVVLPTSNLTWQMLTDPFWNLLGPWLHIQRIVGGIVLAASATIYLLRSRAFAWFVSRDRMSKVFD